MIWVTAVIFVKLFKRVWAKIEHSPVLWNIWVRNRYNLICVSDGLWLLRVSLAYGASTLAHATNLHSILELVFVITVEFSRPPELIVKLVFIR